MLLTEEKAKVISDYIVADKARAERLLGMDPQEAAKEMSAAGCDVTADELVAFGAAMAETAGKEELDATELDNVAGGLGIVATYAIACGIALACGYGVGRLEKW